MSITSIKNFKTFDVQKPTQLHGDEVLVKLQAVGVCGSDIHYYEHGQIGEQVIDFPFTIGHEGSGVIESIGSDVSPDWLGKRIAIEPAQHCGSCSQCMAGRFNTCEKLLFRGCPGQLDGLLTEYVVVPLHCCFEIPPNMTMEEAAFVEPLAITVYAVKRSALTTVADPKVGIFGCGPIGFCTLDSVKAVVDASVYVTDKLAYRLDIAKEAGATWTGDPSAIDPVEQILKNEPKGLDIVYECCGNQMAVEQAIDVLKPGGKLVLIGIPPTLTHWSFPVDKTRRKEIDIINIRRQNDCVPDAIDLLAKGKIHTDLFITHRFSFDKTPEAFDLVCRYDDNVVKAMIEFNS